MRGQFGRGRVSTLFLIGVAMVLAFGVSSCQKPPQVEMDAATAAIEKARAMEAAEYAPNELRAAQDSLAAAQQAVNEQNGKFALLRNYKQAKGLYLAAQQGAAVAEQSAVRNKEQMRRDAEAALAEAQQSIAAARALLASNEGQALRRGKETREALKVIESDIDAVEASLEGVTAAQQQEKYKTALGLARAAREKAASRSQELQQAIDTRESLRAVRK